MPKYGLPNSEKVLAAIGRIAIRHGQLENALRRVLGDLAGVTENEALDATAFTNTRELRIRVRKLAKQRFGDGPLLVRLDSLLERARRASDGRNELVHSTWASENGKVVVRNARHEYLPMPKVEVLEENLKELTDITLELANSRSAGGFIEEAIKKSSKLPRLDPDTE
jgi:hypothetical protein